MKHIKVSRVKLLGSLHKIALPFFAFILFTTIFSFRISTIPDGYSTTEASYIANHDSLKEIVAHGINLPASFINWIGMKIIGSPDSFRVFGSMLLSATVLSMFYAIRKWHNIRIALLTTSLFAVNSVVLSVARSASELSFMMLWFSFVAFVLWARYTKSTRILPFLISIAAVLVLYVPGAFWFVSVLALIYRTRLREILRGIKKKYLAIGISVALIAFSPLIISILNEPERIKTLLLIPDTFSLSDMLRNVGRLPSAFLYKMPDNPAITVGRLPILDVVTGAFVILGAYNYRTYLKWDRAGLLMITAAVALGISAFGNLEAMIVLSIPFVFMLTASGIAYLLEIWYDVFPRNPIARSFGTIAITVLVIISAYYHITRFLVVWPQVPATRATFSLKL